MGFCQKKAYPGTMKVRHRGPFRSLVRSRICSLIRNPCQLVMWEILAVADLVILGFSWWRTLVAAVGPSTVVKGKCDCIESREVERFVLYGFSP